jgi:hypothetical protein
MVRAWHGCGMASVNHTRLHCVNQKGKTHSKLLAVRHGRGTAWARYAMCESVLSSQCSVMVVTESKPSMSSCCLYLRTHSVYPAIFFANCSPCIFTTASNKHGQMGKLAVKDCYTSLKGELRFFVPVPVAWRSTA